MGEYLPGNLQERLRELREANGYKTREKLAEEIGVNKTTYSRIENGSTKTISSDILIKLAELYKVPTDYILGLTNTPENTGYDIKELGLSVDAAKNLYSGKVEPRVVNELLINDKFAMATKMIATYFSGAITQLIATQNKLLDFSYDLLNELTQTGKVPNDKEIQQTKKTLKAAKLPAGNVELDRIQRQLMASIREIKKKLVDEVAEINNNSDILEYEIIEKVKNEALAVPNIQNLPEDEKIKILKDAVIKGIQIDKNISDENMATIEPLIEQSVSMMAKLWNEK
ncbi:helix-turn-helix domain-containing protein [Pseudobutyrivibrio xylanivorans]|uniref:Transcriptional regulator, contains XRE-family HTH domain n=1 Tax=Pseudobutyrivibrio xylanivorans TaxID=185007 RepID=A0A1G5S2Y6_PSEXY|nr:helix-turn-helix transcriptional regulator [Pseudobutyrivibrio xylanivorans]SCZ80666.1 Transcriptional regulator, contains XRE-family HTH domain [Pseudobutyrivibrio xylanivorans]